HARVDPGHRDIGEFQPFGRVNGHYPHVARLQRVVIASDVLGGYDEIGQGPRPLRRVLVGPDQPRAAAHGQTGVLRRLTQEPADYLDLVPTVAGRDEHGSWSLPHGVDLQYFRVTAAVVPQQLRGSHRNLLGGAVVALEHQGPAPDLQIAVNTAPGKTAGVNGLAGVRREVQTVGFPR